MHQLTKHHRSTKRHAIYEHVVLRADLCTCRDRDIALYQGAGTPLDGSCAFRDEVFRYPRLKTAHCTATTRKYYIYR